MATAKDERPTQHKCLLYWHDRCMLGLPIATDRRMVVYPGYNTFDYEDLPYIMSQCMDLIAMKKLELVGIKEVGGEYTEAVKLSKITAKELNKILESTYNPDTLSDLSNPDIIPAVYVRAAADRQVKLGEAVGCEADNIEVVTGSAGL